MKCQMSAFFTSCVGVLRGRQAKTTDSAPKRPEHPLRSELETQLDSAARAGPPHAPGAELLTDRQVVSPTSAAHFLGVPPRSMIGS